MVETHFWRGRGLVLGDAKVILGQVFHERHLTPSYNLLLAIVALNFIAARLNSLIQSQVFNAKLKVSPVTPVVFTAWQSLPKDTEDRKYHVRRHFLSNFHESLKSDLFVRTKTNIKDLEHLVQSVDSFLKVLCSASLCRVFTLASYLVVLGHRHAAYYCRDVNLTDQSVLVKVVHIENKFKLLVKAGTVKVQHPIQELFLVKIQVLVHVDNEEEALC